MDVRQDTQLTWSFEEDKFPDPLMPPQVGFEPRTLNFNNRYSVLYQLSWVEAVTHPITNTAQWCLTSVMYEIPVYQLYHSATDKSLGWGTTLLSCVLQSRSWCSEPCHEFCTTWPLVLLSYKDTRSELTANMILPHESSIAHPPISGVRINYDDEVAWFLHHATRHCEPSTWKLVNSMIHQSSRNGRMSDWTLMW